MEAFASMILGIILTIIVWYVYDVVIKSKREHPYHVCFKYRVRTSSSLVHMHIRDMGIVAVGAPIQNLKELRDALIDIIIEEDNVKPFDLVITSIYKF